MFEQEAPEYTNAYLIKNDFSVSGHFSSLKGNLFALESWGDEARLFLLWVKL